MTSKSRPVVGLELGPWFEPNLDDADERTAIDTIKRSVTVDQLFLLKHVDEVLKESDPRAIVLTSSDDVDIDFTQHETIVPSNVKPSTARGIYDRFDQAGTLNKLYLCQHAGFRGVVEGLRWFEKVPAEETTHEEAAPNPGAVAISLSRSRITLETWADQVDVVLERNGWKRTLNMPRVGKRLFSLAVEGFSPGDGYAFVLDQNHDKALPDPRSRFQPNGVHAASEIMPPPRFPWQDQAWRGVRASDLVIYEMHIGTCTTEGTFLTAIDKIDELVQLGITAIELLPVVQSAGRWNWGYDGVNLFAPYAPYGRPDDLKKFVDACHASGIAVILDVVYNHLGPEGNYLSQFGPYFSRKHSTPWGPALNYDGRQGKTCRQWVLDNVRDWLEEFHFDGLRLDAIHFLFDDRSENIVSEIAAEVRTISQSQERPYLLIGETNVYDGSMIAAPREDGKGFDAIWCDDLMHSLYSVGAPETQLTERQYQQHSDVADALRYGYFYQGPPRERVARAPNEPIDLAHLNSLVMAIQTHDSVGNEPLGRRLHHLAGADFQRAAVVLNLLYPAIPMIFMGDETLEPNPFLFFVDFHDGWLRDAIEKGRRHEHPQQDWTDSVSPLDERAFLDSKLTPIGDGANADQRRAMWDWYRRLIEIRKGWQKRGLLCHQNLSVVFDEATSLYQLQYTHVGESVTVAARLCSPADDATPVRLAIDGTALAASDEVHDSQVTFQRNGVVIVEGSVRRAE